jgi:hypothetical protein
MFPAVIMIIYAALYRLGLSVFKRPSYANYLLITATFIYCLLDISPAHSFLYGPSQAASRIVTGTPARILYCGRTDGNFIFSVRSFDPSLNTVVIRGEKLASSRFAPDEFEQFAHRFGINYVVLERTESQQYFWSGRTTTTAWIQLIHSPAPSMVLEEVLPMRSSIRAFNGELYIYRFTNPSPDPEHLLKIRLNLIGDRIDLKF